MTRAALVVASLVSGGLDAGCGGAWFRRGGDRLASWWRSVAGWAACRSSSGGRNPIGIAAWQDDPDDHREVHGRSGPCECRTRTPRSSRTRRDGLACAEASTWHGCWLNITTYQTHRSRAHRDKGWCSTWWPELVAGRCGSTAGDVSKEKTGPGWQPEPVCQRSRFGGPDLQVVPVNDRYLKHCFGSVAR